MNHSRDPKPEDFALPHEDNNEFAAPTRSPNSPPLAANPTSEPDQVQRTKLDAPHAEIRRLRPTAHSFTTAACACILLGCTAMCVMLIIGPSRNAISSPLDAEIQRLASRVAALEAARVLETRAWNERFNAPEPTKADLHSAIKALDERLKRIPVRTTSGRSQSDTQEGATAAELKDLKEDLRELEKRVSALGG